MSDETQYPQKRMYPRYKLGVPIELHVDGQSAPQRTNTADICLGGCYIETMFTVPVGTRMKIALWLDEAKVACDGVVVTNHPQFGNGLHFENMKPDDEKRLAAYLERFPDNKA
jgi:c-di-GMP-binding flagellar brake protein YcgR